MSVASARATLRIARRNAARSRWRSLLVSLLVLLPVAAMVGAVTVLQTTTPSSERVATGEMGGADLIAQSELPGGTEAGLRSALPAGSRLERMFSESGRLVLPGRMIAVTLRSINLDGLGHGMLTVVEGRAPSGADEVAITRSVAQVTGAGVGGSVIVDGVGSRRVVGIVEDPLNLRARVVLEAPIAAAALPADKVAWLVALPHGETGGPLLSNPDGGASTFVMNLRSAFTASSYDQRPGFMVIGGLALVEAALVAAAAFAVSVRRRQRELGLLAATGAEPRHLATSVLAEGFVLGGLGAAGGVIFGLAGAIASSPWLDDLSNHRNPPVGIDPVWVLIAAAIGMLAALLAALAPAQTAARVPVLAALSGRRPPVAPARRTLRLGLVMITIAVVMTSGGAAIFRDGRGAGMYLILVGAILGTLGLGACSPWLLERFERPAARLPISMRIAFRDAARARSRTGPIVTALLASFAATVTLAALVTSIDAAKAASSLPPLLPDQIVLFGNGVDDIGPQVAERLGAVAAASINIAAGERGLVVVSAAGMAEPVVPDTYPTIGSADLVRALGADAAVGDFERGTVILLAREPLNVTRVTIHVEEMQGSAAVEVAAIDAPARVVQVAVGDATLPGAVLPPEIGARLGLRAVSSEYLIRLGHRVTETDLSQAAGLVAAYPGVMANAGLPPQIVAEGLRTAVLVASLLFGLAVTGIAVALGEAESRPEQRTLLALGAEPRLRRRIAAARAGVLTMLGSVLAVPAGLLPVWGILSTRGDPLVVPIPEVLSALVVLPVLSMAGAFLLTRPIPDWSAFRSASG